MKKLAILLFLALPLAVGATGYEEPEVIPEPVDLCPEEGMQEALPCDVCPNDPGVQATYPCYVLPPKPVVKSAPSAPGGGINWCDAGETTFCRMPEEGITPNGVTLGAQDVDELRAQAISLIQQILVLLRAQLTLLN